MWTLQLALQRFYIIASVDMETGMAVKVGWRPHDLNVKLVKSEENSLQISHLSSLGPFEVVCLLYALI